MSSGAREMIELFNEMSDESETPILLMDSFDEALLGHATRFGGLNAAAYDLNKCIAILVEQGMTEEEAWEYFDFNIIGAWVGETTPIFVQTPTRIATEES